MVRSMKISQRLRQHNLISLQLTPYMRQIASIVPSTLESSPPHRSQDPIPQAAKPCSSQAKIFDSKDIDMFLTLPVSQSYHFLGFIFKVHGSPVTA